MVYKKYIKRGNKVFGPYYYESYRKGEDIKKKYIGKKEDLKKIKRIKNYLLFLFGFLFISFMIYSFIYHPKISGKAIVKLEPIYKENETIEGNLKIILKEGELIPKDSFIKIKLNEQEKIIPISELIKEEPKEGNYYIENTNIEGFGEGYGFYGTKEIYPEISFTLKIKEKTKESPIKNEESTRETQEESQEEFIKQTETTTQEEKSESISSEEPPETEKQEQQEKKEKESSITGAAITTTKYTTEGKVIKGNPFIYNLNEDETAEIVKGSVNIFGEPLDEKYLSLDIKDNKVIIKTEYVLFEKGFGKDYLNDRSKELKISLKNFDLKAEKGILKAELLYNNETIESTEINILIKEKTTEQEHNITEEKITLNLLKNIEDITIEKNSEYNLNLSNYFYSNKEIEYKIIINKNIDTKIRDNILTIIPNKNYKGTSTSKIIAKLKDNENITTESNEFNIIVTEKNTSINIETIQVAGAKIGQPVKFVKKVKINKTTQISNLSLAFPIEAENISVKKIIKQEDDENKKEIQETKKIDISITGNVALEIELKKEKSPIILFIEYLKNIPKKILGKVIEEKENIEQEIKEIIIQDNATEYEIEFEMPPAIANETIINENKKIITITGSDKIHYVNITAYTFLDKEIEEKNIHKIKLYKYLEDGSKELVNFDAYDTNDNGLIDYIEWIIPKLSEQQYELIIEISKAEHLDEKRNFVEDIYDFVKALDNITYVIPKENYVRVEFKEELCNKNDITIYANGSGKVEVYLKDSDEKIADFGYITKFDKYKIRLTNLTSKQKYFDLKVTDGYVEFDYIVDPDPICSGTLVKDCGFDNQAECEAAGCFWYNDGGGWCSSPADICSSYGWGVPNTDPSYCLGYVKEYYNSSPYIYGFVCDRLEQCDSKCWQYTTEEECPTDYCTWFGDTCQPQNPMECGASSNCSENEHCVFSFYLCPGAYSSSCSLINYNLTISVNPSGAGTTNPSIGSHEYPEGMNVTVTATPNEGYNFSYWSGDCSGNGSCVVNMNSDKNVVANFVSSSCNVSLVNTTKSEWQNIGCVGYDMNQSRYWTQYDENNCGEVENVTYYEYQLLEANLMNTSWSEWQNLTCVNEQMNQSRYLTQYDANNTGCYENNTEYEYRLDGPILQNTTFGEWQEDTCIGNQMRLKQSATQYDLYGCKANETIYNYTFVGPNWTYTDWSDWQNVGCAGYDMNQSRSRIKYDLYSCGENVTEYEYRLLYANIIYTGWTDWQNVGCIGYNMNQSRYRIQYDANNVGCFENQTEYDYRLNSCNSGYVCSNGVCVISSSSGGGGSSGGSSTTEPSEPQCIPGELTKTCTELKKCPSEEDYIGIIKRPETNNILSENSLTGNVVKDSFDKKSNNLITGFAILNLYEGKCSSYNSCNSEGEIRCITTSAYQICQKDKNNCLKWSSQQKVSQGMICKDDKFICSSYNSCNSEGEIRCITTSAYQICQKDNTGCLKWSGNLNCKNGMQCESNKGCLPKEEATEGFCKEGEKRCYNNAVIECKKTYNSKTRTYYYMWSGVQSCPSGTTCEEGICKSNTEGFCKEGEKRCYNNAVIECKKTYNSKTRTYYYMWSGVQSCP
ncbi:MAG: hypothetical protein QW117_00960, partial [Candidatus Pacearchaeota archaeon]